MISKHRFCTVKDLKLKALGWLEDFEKSADWALFHDFTMIGLSHTVCVKVIRLHKDDADESTVSAKFLIGNQFHLTRHILIPEILKH